MKILFIIPWFLPNKGGAEIGAYEMARELVHRGHEVLVVSLKYRRDWADREEIDGVQIVRLPTFGIPFMTRLTELIHSLTPFFSLRRIIENFKPDLIHLHYVLFTGHAGMYFAKKLNIPTVLTLVGSDIYDPQYCPGAFLYPWNRDVIHQADQVVAACPFISDQLKSKFDYTEGHLQVIPYGVTPDKFKPHHTSELTRSRFKLPANNPMILSVHRLHPRKGVRFLIDAAEEVIRSHPTAMFVIVGDGPERDTLEHYCRSRNLSKNVIFMGKISFDSLTDLYHASDLFVLHSYHEGFGIVLLEAMACSKAVVSTRTGGTETIIEEGKTGFLVPPASPRPMADAINRLLSDPDLRQAMGQNGHDRVHAHFRWTHIMDRYLDVYQSAITRHHAAHAKP